MSRIDEHQAVGAEEMRHPDRERLSEGSPGLIGLLQQRQDLRFELRRRRHLIQRVDTGFDFGRELQSTDRHTLLGWTVVIGNALQLTRLIQEIDVVDLGEIVIVRGQPEDRHDGRTELR